MIYIFVKPELLMEFGRNYQLDVNQSYFKGKSGRTVGLLLSDEASATSSLSIPDVFVPESIFQKIYTFPHEAYYVQVSKELVVECILEPLGREYLFNSPAFKQFMDKKKQCQ